MLVNFLGLIFISASQFYVYRVKEDCQEYFLIILWKK